MSLELLCVNYGKFNDARDVLHHCRDLMKFDKVSLFHPAPFVQSNVDVRQVHSKNQNECWAVEVPKMISCDHVLSIHWDGFIVRPEMWDPAWLEYDYIGAPWPLTNIPNKEWRVGSSGFFMFSKRMAQAWPGICNIYDPFDWQVGALHRDKFEALGMKYAPIKVAGTFCKECDLEDMEIPEHSTFGFHGFQYGNGAREEYRKRVYA